MSSCASVNSSQLFNHGKKWYIDGNYSKAAYNLSKSCSLMSYEKHDTWDEWFESHFYYAKALYMLSRFSPNLIEIKDNNIIEKDNKLDEMFYRSKGISDIVKESENIEEVDNENDKNGGDWTEVECNVAKNIDDQKVVYNSINDGNEEENESHSDNNMIHIVMARENIRLAKLILKTQLSDKKLPLSNNDLESKMADYYELSGDIYVENAFKKAIDKNEKALKLRCKNVPSLNRLIAESYYKIAMLYFVNYRYVEAKLNFERCLYVLKYIRYILLNDNANTDDFDSFLLKVNEKIAEVTKEVSGSSLKPQADVSVGDISKFDRTNENREPTDD